MQRLLSIGALLALLTLTLVACGGGSSGTGGATLSMSGGSFTGATSITIQAGQSVTFDDSTGGTHKLVTGTNGVLAVVSGAPSIFASADGLALNAGDKKTITFPTAGTYHITCTIHPSMQATITVDTASGY